MDLKIDVTVDQSAMLPPGFGQQLVGPASDSLIQSLEMLSIGMVDSLTSDHDAMSSNSFENIGDGPNDSLLSAFQHQEVDTHESHVTLPSSSSSSSPSISSPTTATSTSLPSHFQELMAQSHDGYASSSDSEQLLLSPRFHTHSAKDDWDSGMQHFSSSQQYQKQHTTALQPLQSPEKPVVSLKHQQPQPSQQQQQQQQQRVTHTAGRGRILLLPHQLQSPLYDQESFDHRDRYLFVDNGNVFVGAQSMANGTMDLAVRLNVREFASLIEEGNPPALRELAASRPSNPRICSTWKKISYYVHSDNTGTSARHSLCRRIQAIVNDPQFDQNPQTIVLASGDGTHFPSLVDQAASRGWNVIVWSWARCLSDKFRKLVAQHPKHVTIRLLDDFRDKITFRANPRAAMNSSNGTSNPANNIHAANGPDGRGFRPRTSSSGPGMATQTPSDGRYPAPLGFAPADGSYNPRYADSAATSSLYHQQRHPQQHHQGYYPPAQQGAPLSGANATRNQSHPPLPARGLYNMQSLYGNFDHHHEFPPMQTPNSTHNKNVSYHHQHHQHHHHQQQRAQDLSFQGQFARGSQRNGSVGGPFGRSSTNNGTHREPYSQAMFSQAYGDQHSLQAEHLHDQQQELLSALLMQSQAHPQLQMPPALPSPTTAPTPNHQVTSSPSSTPACNLCGQFEAAVVLGPCRHVRLCGMCASYATWRLCPQCHKEVQIGPK